MNLFRTLGGVALLGMAGAALNSCINAPSYPIEPSIDFSSLKMLRNRPSGQLEIDTLTFAVNFKDGDGDLGLSDADITMAPWNTTTGGHNNRGYKYNYFIQPFLKNSNGQFVQFITPAPFGFVGEYDGRYLRLDGTDAKPAPLRGTLRYKLPLTLDGSIYKPGQTFRFEISIMDRSLHESNKITTAEVTLGQ